MRGWLLLFLPIIINTLSFDHFSNHRIDLEYLPNRKERATIRETATSRLVSRHIKLARVLNAIYLQMELADGKINGEDVVAGVFNLKDKTVLQKLVSLKTDKLSGQLNALKTSVEAIPDDLKQIADIDAIRDGYKTVIEISEEMRTTLNESTDAENIPNFIKVKTDFEQLTKLSDNLAEKVLGKLTTIENSPSYVSDMFTKLNNDIRACKDILQYLPAELDSVRNDSGKTLHGLVNGTKVAITIYKKAAEFRQLSNLFSNTQVEFEKIKSLDSINKMIEMKQDINQIKYSFDEICEPPTNISIGSAFISNHNLSQIYDDIQENWLKSLLNERKDLKKLESVLEQFRKFTKEIAHFNENESSLVKLLRLGSLFHILDFADIIGNHQDFSKNTKMASLTSCLNIPKSVEPDALKEMEHLSTDLENVFNVISIIHDILNKVTNKTVYIEKMKKYYTVNGGIEKEHFEDWKKSSELQDMKTVFGKSSVMFSLFESLKQNDSFINSMKKLTTVYPQIQEIQTWIFETKLGSDECDPVFKFDIEKLNEVNELPKIISRVKSGKHIEKLQVVVETLPKLKTSLTALNSVYTKPNRSKRSTEAKELTIKRKNLLEVAFAVHSLEQINQVDGFKKDLETLIQKGDSVLVATKNVKDSKKKKELDDAWKDFASLKKQLENLKKNINKAIDSIKSTPEKKLEDVGSVYKSISDIPFAETIRLRQLRESMRLLDDPIPEVEKALENLEKPVSTNWGLVHTNFKKVPNALIELQNDFIQFFYDEDDEKKKADDSGIDKKLFMYAGGAIVGLALIIATPFIVRAILLHDPDLKKEPPKEKPYEGPKEEADFKFSYMQLQDARLKINRRDKKTGNTPIYTAVCNRDFNTINKLMEQGAVLDSTNSGPKCRTALFELVLLKDEKYIKKFLAKGADQCILDSAGEDSDTWADPNGYFELFEYYYKVRKFSPIRRTLPPDTPRPWNILVFDKKCFSIYKRKKLPIRIKTKITWGYKTGMDLSSFTHIVLPKKYVKNEKTLFLDDKDLMTFRLYGCWAVLMTPKWLESLADPKVGEKALDRDNDWMILNTFYHGKQHENSVFEIKTNIHRLQPGLLTNTGINILSTKDKSFMRLKKEWQEIIELFGGENSKKIQEDDDTVFLPYWGMDRQGSAQNRCWILKFPDCKIDPEWRSIDRYSCMDFQYLPEVLARNTILDVYNDIVPVEGADKDSKEAVSAMDKRALKSQIVRLKANQPKRRKGK